MSLGERKSPYIASDLQGLLFNVEDLNDARTLHGKRRVSACRGRAGEKSDFFSILLGFIRRGADNRGCRM
jgi:hypothetical protein